MLRVGQLVRAAAVAGGFSSATFTGDETSSSKNNSTSRGTQQQQECSSQASRMYGSAAFTEQATSSTSTSTKRPGEELQRPTIETYRAMSDEDLTQLLRTRARQVRQLRTIYENFHYEADKCFRKIIFDYHDKTIGLSAAHGKMQTASLQINREVLCKLREEHERLNRDRRIILVLAILLTLIFWLWVKRHYVERKKLVVTADTLVDRALEGNFVTGFGSRGAGLFSSRRRSGRVRETDWEKEARAQREQGEQKQTKKEEAHGGEEEGHATADQALLRALKKGEA